MGSIRFGAGVAAAIVLTAALEPSSAVPQPTGTPAPDSTAIAFRGPGAWVDIYDSRALWNDPQGTAARMKAAGATTVYLETANYRQPPGRLVVRPAQVEQLIDAAHGQGLAVVGWYLPGLKDIGRDLQRIRAALTLSTPLGGRLDAFALDLESSLVPSVAQRNAAVIDLSRQVRTQVGAGYALGAIVPDDRSTRTGGLWPEFPYRALRGAYDVFLPMSYSSYRAAGAAGVYPYTLRNVRRLRRLAGDPTLPVHLLGGLAGALSDADARAAVQAAARTRSLGASFYSFASSTSGEWQALRRWFGSPVPAPPGGTTPPEGTTAPGGTAPPDGTTAPGGSS
jgi:hypothetical protein